MKTLNFFSPFCVSTEATVCEIRDDEKWNDQHIRCIKIATTSETRAIRANSNSTNISGGSQSQIFAMLRI